MKDSAITLYRAGNNPRPYAVINDLELLTSEIEGVVELPIWLNWTPHNKYDMDKTKDVARLYATVLNYALESRDLVHYLDKDTLIHLWRDIPMASPVREMWETTHPCLRGA